MPEGYLAEEPLRLQPLLPAAVYRRFSVQGWSKIWPLGCVNVASVSRCARSRNPGPALFPPVVPVDDLEDLVGGAPGRVEGLGEGGRLADLHAALHDAEEGHRDGPHRPPAAGLVAFLRVGGDFGLCDSIGSGKAADSHKIEKVSGLMLDKYVRGSRMFQFSTAA